MIVYRFNVIEALKDAGYNTTRILRENIIPQSSMQKIRKGEIVGGKTLNTLCRLLDKQPGDILEYIAD